MKAIIILKNKVKPPYPVTKIDKHITNTLLNDKKCRVITTNVVNGKTQTKVTYTQ